MYTHLDTSSKELNSKYTQIKGLVLNVCTVTNVPQRGIHFRTAQLQKSMGCISAQKLLSWGNELVSKT